MLNVELSCARALPADGQSAVRAMGTMGMMGEPGDIGAMEMMGDVGAIGAMGLMGMMGAPGMMVMDEMGAMWERCGLWHGRARYENMDTLRALSADIFE